MRIDVHAHYWTDEYLGMIAALDSDDTAAQRDCGAGGGADLEARLDYVTASGLAPGDAERVLGANAVALFGSEAFPELPEPAVS